MTTNHGMRRALLYGSAAPVLGVLLWFGFGYEADPDFAQALSAANTELRMAAAMPPADRDGTPLQARLSLLADAEKNLAAARRQDPHSPVLLEFEGYLSELRGDRRAAAASYRRAQEQAGADREQYSVLVFSEARALAGAGEAAAALAVLRGAQERIDVRWIPQCLLEQASLLRGLGRHSAADAVLREVMLCDEPLAWADAGRQWQAMGDTASAESAFARAASRVPSVDVLRARLKLAAGDVEKCWQLLDSAASAAPAETRRLLREEPAAWQAIAEDERFQRLIGTDAATPGR